MTPDQRFWTIFHGLIMPLFTELGLLYILLVGIVYGTLFLLSRYQRAHRSSHEARNAIPFMVGGNQAPKVDSYPQEEEELKVLTY